MHRGAQSAWLSHFLLPDLPSCPQGPPSLFPTSFCSICSLGTNTKTVENFPCPQPQNSPPRSAPIFRLLHNPLPSRKLTWKPPKGPIKTTVPWIIWVSMLSQGSVPAIMKAASLPTLRPKLPNPVKARKPYVPALNKQPETP